MKLHRTKKKKRKRKRSSWQTWKIRLKSCLSHSGRLLAHATQCHFWRTVSCGPQGHPHKGPWCPLALQWDALPYMTIEKTKQHSKGRQLRKFLSAAGVMNLTNISSSTRHVENQSCFLAQGFLIYGYVLQGAKFFYYWWRSSGPVTQMYDMKHFFCFWRNKSHMSIDFRFLEDWI